MPLHHVLLQGTSFECYIPASFPRASATADLYWAASHVGRGIRD